MLAVGPISGDSGDEELRAISVEARLGHREYPRFGVLQLEVFVYIFM